MAPAYPAKALSAGLAGHVVVEFEVTVHGRPTNPVVLASEPPGVFDDAAQRAVRRFVYRPARIGGVSTPMRGVRERFRFRVAP